MVQFSMLLWGLTACDAPTAPDDAPVPIPAASIEIANAAVAVLRGETLQLHAVVKAANGVVLQGRSVTWQSLTPALLGVDATGLVTGLAEGAGTLLVSTAGTAREVHVPVGPSRIASISLGATATTLREGLVQQLAPEVRNALGEVVHLVNVTYETADAQVATVTDGQLRAVAEGTTVVRARAGDAETELEVRVTPDFGGILMFVKRVGNPTQFEKLFRADPLDFDASVQDIFPGGVTWQPAVSKWGKVAFACNSDGPGICVSNLDGSGVQWLTGGDLFYEDQPTWSPDGMQIAFRRWAQGATPGMFNPTDIWVMDADGSDQRNLTDDDRSQSWPAWQPVATGGVARIAFVQDSVVDGYATSRVATMDAFGHDFRYETRFGMWEEIRPTWSPDGYELVFTRNGETFADVIVGVNRRTQEEFNFLAEPLPAGGQFHPVFSPSGRYLVFASRHELVNGSSEPLVYTVRIDGRDVRRRSTTTAGLGEFSWIPTP